MRDPGFRAALRAAGWLSGQPVVMASDDEAVADVLARMAVDGIGDRALVAVADDAAPFGFRLMSAGVALGSADVGMLPVGRISGQRG